MSTLQDVLGPFWVHPDSVAAMAIATDGIKKDCKIAMVALCPLEGEPISLFVRGADIAATRQYHGIPDAVYDSLAVDQEEVRETLQTILDQQGIHTIVANQAFRFVKDRLLTQKIVHNKLSFLDTALMDKATMFWSERLGESQTLIDMQTKIQNMRGNNTVSLEVLAAKYDIPDILESEVSPYVPENKARLTKDLALAMLGTELAV